MDLREGDQLQFGFMRDMVISREPWGGRSPRGLTRVGLGLILQPWAEKSVSEIDCAQLDMFAMKEASPLYRGAPLLIPLLERGDGNG